MGLAGPVRLGVDDRHRAGCADREDLLIRGVFLPLEDERRGSGVPAHLVELHWSLDAAQRYAAVQVADDLHVIGALGGYDRLGGDLTHSVALGHVGIDVRW